MSPASTSLFQEDLRTTLGMGLVMSCASPIMVLQSCISNFAALLLFWNGGVLTALTIYFCPKFYGRHRGLILNVFGALLACTMYLTSTSVLTGIFVATENASLHYKMKRGPVLLTKITLVPMTIGAVWPNVSFGWALFQLVLLNLSRIQIYGTEPGAVTLGLEFIPLQFLFAFVLPAVLQLRWIKHRKQQKELLDEAIFAYESDAPPYTQCASASLASQIKVHGLVPADIPQETMDKLRSLLQKKLAAAQPEADVLPDLLCVAGCILLAVQLTTLRGGGGGGGESGSAASMAAGPGAMELLTAEDTLSVLPPELRERVTRIFQAAAPRAVGKDGRGDGDREALSSLVLSPRTPLALPSAAFAAPASSWASFWYSSYAPAPEMQAPAGLTVSIARSDGGALDLTQLRADWTPCLLVASLSGVATELFLDPATCHWAVDERANAAVLFVPVPPAALATPGCLSLALQRKSTAPAHPRAGPLTTIETAPGPFLLGPVRWPVIPPPLVALLCDAPRISRAAATALARDLACLLASGPSAPLAAIAGRILTFLRAKGASARELHYLTTVLVPHLRGEAEGGHVAEGAAADVALHPFSLRFRDPAVERAFADRAVNYQSTALAVMYAISLFLPFAISLKAQHPEISFLRLQYVPAYLARLAVTFVFLASRGTFKRHRELFSHVFTVAMMHFAVEKLPEEIGPLLMSVRVGRALSMAFGTFFVGLHIRHVFFYSFGILLWTVHRAHTLVARGAAPAAFLSDGLPQLIVSHVIGFAFNYLGELFLRKRFAKAFVKKVASERAAKEIGYDREPRVKAKIV